MSKKITCVVVDDEPIARDILTSYIEKIPNLHLVKSCKNAVEAFEEMNISSIDLFFLDINMPEITGLSLAKLIPKDSKVIFTTAYREYALEGFNLKAVDYLLKPIAFDRFLEAVNTYFEAVKPLVNTAVVDESFKSDFFFVRSERKMVKINFNEIIYIESLSDYLKIHFQDKSVVTRETITNIEAKLPQQKFLRTHRSYIVALNRIESYTNEYVELQKKQSRLADLIKKRF